MGCLATAIASVRQVLGSTATGTTRLGICTFSCHRHWQAVKQNPELAKFHDAPSFYDYVRSLGADGVQTSVTSLDKASAKAFRAQVESSGGYYEGDIRLPQSGAELSDFERDVELTRLAGASVARSVLSGSRRYETWTSLEQFRVFQTQAAQRLAMVEPILRRHGLKLAIENHKDLTADELSQSMRQLSSEWIGVNIDTGNNLALLDDPYTTIELLSPFALSVHLKDMAIQSYEDGFLLSEVPCGDGFLDLPRIVATLRKSNANVALNLEMATRDPLRVPCRTKSYWSTFPQRQQTHLAAALAQVSAHVPKTPLPQISGMTMAEQLASEQTHNAHSLTWMHQHLV